MKIDKVRYIGDTVSLELTHVKSTAYFPLNGAGTAL